MWDTFCCSFSLLDLLFPITNSAILWQLYVWSMHDFACGYTSVLQCCSCPQSSACKCFMSSCLFSLVKLCPTAVRCKRNGEGQNQAADKHPPMLSTKCLFIELVWLFFFSFCKSIRHHNGRNYKFINKAWLGSDYRMIIWSRGISFISQWYRSPCFIKGEMSIWNFASRLSPWKTIKVPGSATKIKKCSKIFRNQILSTTLSLRDLTEKQNLL